MDFNYFIIGLNHKSADLSLRERVNIPENKISQAQRQLKNLLDPIAIEQVILSTLITYLWKNEPLTFISGV